MKAIVLKVKDGIVKLITEENKVVKIKVGKEIEKKLLPWDVVDIKQGTIKVEKRRKPNSVEKIKGLIKNAKEKERLLKVRTTVYGKVKFYRGNYYLKSLKKELYLKLKPKNKKMFGLLKGLTVIIDNGLLLDNELIIDKYSRVFSSQEG